MNLYFLVEGRRSESKIYPAWLSFSLPEYTRVIKPEDAVDNNYYLISGEGYPHILHHARQASETISGLEVKYDWLVVVLDSEESSVEQRMTEVNRVLEKFPLPEFAQHHVIVQHRCIETWLLGNRRVYSRFPQSDILKKYQGFFDVSKSDPEEMKIPPFFSGTTAMFHAAYLKETLRDKTKKNSTYTKRNPGQTTEKAYYDELVRRYEETGHIVSFRSLLSFLEKVQT